MELAWTMAILVLLKGIFGQRMSSLVGVGLVLGATALHTLLAEWSAAPAHGTAGYWGVLLGGSALIALLSALLRPLLVGFGNKLLFAVRLGWLAESPLNRPLALLMGVVLGAAVLIGVHLFLPPDTPQWGAAVLAVAGAACWVLRRYRAWKGHAMTRARSDFTFWQR